MATVNYIPEVSSAHFEWKDGSGMQEMSMLEHLNLTHITNPNRIYPDACDEGFIVKSEKTGRKLIFSLDNIHVVDDEVISWHYSAWAEMTDRNRSKALDGSISILIIND